MIAVAEARPESDLPGPAPAGAGIAPSDEGLFGCVRQPGRTPRGDLIIRIESIKRRDVSMLGIDLFIVFQPFLEAAGAGADLVGRQLPRYVLQAIGPGEVDTQVAGGG